MARASSWAIGLVVSAVAHIGMGAALMAALKPQEIEDQATPKSSLTVTPEVVARSDAAEQTPQSDATDARDPDGSKLDAGAVATSVAQSQTVQAPRAAPQTMPAASVSNSVTPTTAPVMQAVPDVSAAVAPQTDQSIASAPRQEAAQPTATTSSIAVATAKSFATTQSASVIPSVQTTVSLSPAPAMITATQALQDAALQSTQPQSSTAQPQAPKPAQSTATTLVPTKTAANLPTVDAAASAEPANVALPSSAPQMTATKAVLAFPNVGAGAVDPASVAAFQSFTQPPSDAADPVRDNLQSLLSLPCARMQVTFDPETTSLQLIGHVPQDAQRAPVLAALQAQMGNNITVTDNLLVLPAPQCGALSGISAVGLPQSTDQITNPLIVGADTHARSFRYVQNDPLVLDLTAPDYLAYVYVDYFDADGNVIHLSPNAQAPLAQTTPKERLQIGARAPDDPGLRVLIGPPYGQEIAVAFASSAPLYAQERPLVEPADAYLNWLKQKVAEARAADPDFKGEWVYFFVQTAAE